jgi:hypothetical protein
MQWFLDMLELMGTPMDLPYLEGQMSPNHIIVGTLSFAYLVYAGVYFFS